MNYIEFVKTELKPYKNEIEIAMELAVKNTTGLVKEISKLNTLSDLTLLKREVY